MKTKEEIKAWLLENAVDENGDLDLSCLDFSDFEGDVYIDGMVVKKDLVQNCQNVGGYLHQDFQEVEGNLYQNIQEVKGNLYQGNQEVEGNLYQSNLKVKGTIY